MVVSKVFFDTFTFNKNLICSIKFLIKLKLLICSIRLSFDTFNKNYKILVDSSAECACDLHVIIT